jgi:phosphoribosylformimino-5-aminoimidazole carboxamide ribotide isomerase
MVGKPRVWDVYPAIDLRRGRVVRLMQGDPERETEYGRDPLRVAQRWLRAGARWLHVVNLDGALDEEAGGNWAALGKIAGAGARVQFGGGLRDFAGVSRALELGVSRVVLGTAAVEDPGLVARSLATFGVERIAVGIDARDGVVRTHGWQRGAGVDAASLGREWAARGVRWAVFTDVTRDGTGGGLNVAATGRLARLAGLQVIASGGVSTLDDVQRAYRAELSGVIIGRALYEGAIRLEDALRIARPALESGGDHE